MTRKEALDKLLQPITWNWSSPVRARQNLVSSRHSQVRTVYPFLLDDERGLADAWFKDNRFSDLWD